jgi:hypothetical protein
MAEQSTIDSPNHKLQLLESARHRSPPELFKPRNIQRPQRHGGGFGLGAWCFS